MWKLLKTKEQRLFPVFNWRCWAFIYSCLEIRHVRSLKKYTRFFKDARQWADQQTDWQSGFKIFYSLFLCGLVLGMFWQTFLRRYKKREKFNKTRCKGVSLKNSKHAFDQWQWWLDPARSSRIGQSGLSSPWQWWTRWSSVLIITWRESIFSCKALIWASASFLTSLEARLWSFHNPRRTRMSSEEKPSSLERRMKHKVWISSLL